MKRKVKNFREGEKFREAASEISRGRREVYVGGEKGLCHERRNGLQLVNLMDIRDLHHSFQDLHRSFLL